MVQTELKTFFIFWFHVGYSQPQSLEFAGIDYECIAYYKFCRDCFFSLRVSQWHWGVTNGCYSDTLQKISVMATPKMCK